ncbi:hypothetical protein B0J12DRAFT_646532 [Macrophomina phaseolina]|uniref:Secreted protein n=1 Tax=Macrophomina phaseolina TaxID=35725 RepID=A0ABQ8GNR2_9PEZI|nr:hypothetical protein B0J12DRAFT_646532 [Macrophomina phaseolina]
MLPPRAIHCFFTACSAVPLVTPYFSSLLGCCWSCMPCYPAFTARSRLLVPIRPPQQFSVSCGQRPPRSRMVQSSVCMFNHILKRYRHGFLSWLWEQKQISQSAIDLSALRAHDTIPLA